MISKTSKKIVIERNISLENVFLTTISFIGFITTVGTTIAPPTLGYTLFLISTRDFIRFAKAHYKNIIVERK